MKQTYKEYVKEQKKLAVNQQIQQRKEYWKPKKEKTEKIRKGIAKQFSISKIIPHYKSSPKKVPFLLSYAKSIESKRK